MDVRNRSECDFVYTQALGIIRPATSPFSRIGLPFIYFSALLPLFVFASGAGGKNLTFESVLGAEEDSEVEGVEEKYLPVVCLWHK